MARELKRAPQQSRGPGASTQPSSPLQRVMSPAAGSSLRGPSTFRAQSIYTEMTAPNGIDSHTHSSHVPTTVGESNRDRRTQHQGNDQYAERTPTFVRSRSPRVEMCGEGLQLPQLRTTTDKTMFHRLRYASTKYFMLLNTLWQGHAYFTKGRFRSV